MGARVLCPGTVDSTSGRLSNQIVSVQVILPNGSYPSLTTNSQREFNLPGVGDGVGNWLLN